MNRMYEAEQAENLQSDREKVVTAKDWQAQEIDKLSCKVKALSDKLREITAERDEYKAICEKQVASGWEIINAKEARAVMGEVIDRGGNDKVFVFDFNQRALLDAYEEPFYILTDEDRIYLHRIKEA